MSNLHCSLTNAAVCPLVLLPSLGLILQCIVYVLLFYLCVVISSPYAFAFLYSATIYSQYIQASTEKTALSLSSEICLNIIIILNVYPGV